MQICEGFLAKSLFYKLFTILYSFLFIVSFFLYIFFCIHFFGTVLVSILTKTKSRSFLVSLPVPSLFFLKKKRAGKGYQVSFHPFSSFFEEKGRKTLNLLSWKGYRDTPYFKKSFTKKAKLFLSGFFCFK